MNKRLFPQIPEGRGAEISDDEVYRYRLWRTISPSQGTILWVMLNPSTADADTDDPTIRRVLGFSGFWGFHRVEVVNLFAFRATDPSEMKRTIQAGGDAVGPANMGTIARLADECDEVVLAWGAATESWPAAAKAVADKARAGAIYAIRIASHSPPVCLGSTASGAPSHPLYLPRDAAREPFIFR